MAVTVGEEVSGGRTFSVISGPSTGELLSSARTFSIISFPSVGEQLSVGKVVSVVKATANMEASQTRVFALVTGRLDNNRLRAWTFTLDGHDFYVLRLGETETLIYDISTETWMEWNSLTHPFWRPNTGFNWIGLGAIAYNSGAASQVVCGDDTFGLLWTLDPDSGVDESPREDLPDDNFPRKVVGGVPMRMRETQQVGAVYLSADLGSPQLTGAFVSLRTSDDNGKTWTSHGTITTEAGNYDQEFVWRSLGLIKAPGRIFEISDNGATVRIDGLDMR